ncbi:hypothetical protein HDU89_003876 [Geranomyces variabilis]|nr:hypothetical protein HDU89_003876 [Geranomyces variabilis]
MVSASAFALVCVSALMISGASAATNSTAAAANTTEPAICTNYYASCERARSACSGSSSSAAAASCVPATSGDWAAGSCPACNSTSFFNVSDAAGAVLSPQPFTFVLGEATPLLIKGYCLSRCRDGRAAAIVLETGKVNKNGDDEWVGFCACDGRSAPIEPFEVGQLVSVPAGSGGPGVAIANVSINGNRTTSTAASPSSASGTATTSLAAANAATSFAAATASAQAGSGQTSANSAGHATSAASVFALLAVFAASYSAVA